MFTSQKLTSDPPLLRRKINSLHQVKRTISQKSQQQQQFQHLCQSRPASKRTPKKSITTQSLIQYTLQVLEEVYRNCPYSLNNSACKFLTINMEKMKPKIQQRLSLLKYMQQSLMDRNYSQIQTEIKRQWRKNVLFQSLNMLWANQVKQLPLKSSAEFVKLYEQQRHLIANLSSFYFATCLAQLKQSFSMLLEETSHGILNSHKEWPEIYEKVLIPLLPSHQDINFLIDIRELKINPYFLDCEEPISQLPKTSQIIKKIANDVTVFGKIQLLKQFRASFEKQLQINAQRIAAKHKGGKMQIMQKQDVIGCTIYAIVQSKSQNIALSLQALALLVGQQQTLLTKKGVDCFYADLQSACYCLTSDQFASSLITLPKNHLHQL